MFLCYLCYHFLPSVFFVVLLEIFLVWNWTWWIDLVIFFFFFFFLCFCLLSGRGFSKLSFLSSTEFKTFILYSFFYLHHFPLLKVWALGVGSFFFFFFFFWSFLGPCLWYMEVPRLGSSWTCSCQPTPQSQQYQIHAMSETYTTAHSNARSSTHWTRPGIEPASSWLPARFVSAEPRWELLNVYFLINKIIIYVP